MRRSRVVVAASIVALVTAAGRAEARSLVERIDKMFGERGITLTEDQVNGLPHEAHFSSDSLARLGTLTAQLAASAADFPAISTVPGFTYRYNPTLEVYELSSQSLGSVFVERPLTVGRGRFDVGATYSFIDFDNLDGKDLDHLAFRGLKHQDCCGGPNTPGDPAFERDTADIVFEKFKLQSHVISLFATYGVTDHWDVNVLLPIVRTELEARAVAVLHNTTIPPTHFFNLPAGTTREIGETSDEKTGIGDVKLRTKYTLLDGDPIALAPALTLSLPTGDQRDFQGTGDTTITPLLAVSKELSIVDLHGAFGFEVNADSLDRSRIRYGAGATVQVIKQFAFLLDVIGNSNIEHATLTAKVPIFRGTQFVGNEKHSSDFRTDIVDLAVGFKANIAGTAVAFFDVLVPLNDDGLRADFIPTAGLEASF